MPQRFHRRSILLAMGCFLPLTVCHGIALAEAPGANGAPGTRSASVAEIFLSELEKRIIGDYYRRHVYEREQSPEGRDYRKHKNKQKQKQKHKGLPPGLAKKGKLPPGIAKQLARNGHLPPGLEYRSLPHDLIVQLPPLEPAYRYVIVDNRVMLIRAASNLILDVLEVAAIEILN